MQSLFSKAVMLPMTRLRGITIATLLLSPACAVFADCTAEMLIERTNGETLTLPVSAATKITQDGKSLYITTAGIEKTVAISEIVGISYKEAEVSVDEIADTPDAPHFSFNGKGLIVSGISAGEKINIYSIDGKLIYTDTCVDDSLSRITVPTDRLAAGIYIVKTESGTFKFIKR